MWLPQFASSTTMWTWSRTAALTLRLRLTGTCPFYLQLKLPFRNAENPSPSIFPSVPCSIPCSCCFLFGMHMLFTVSTHLLLSISKRWIWFPDMRVCDSLESAASLWTNHKKPCAPMHRCFQFSRLTGQGVNQSERRQEVLSNDPS